MPKIEYKFDLGHLLTLAIMVLSGAIAYGRITADLADLKEQVAAMRGLSERIVRVETQLQERRR